MIARRRFMAALVAAPLLAAGAAAGQTAGVEIVDAYARATPPGAMAGAAYGTLRSTGPADRLIGARSPAAAQVMIHENVETDGVMQMRPVEALDIGAGGEAVLAPGGMHVMLMGLGGPLVEGGSLEITFVFEGAGEVTVEVPIRAFAAE